MKNNTKKLVCIVMSVCLIATGAPLCSPIASAAKSSSTQVSQEQRKEELEKQLAETDKKLKELGKEKKDARDAALCWSQAAFAGRDALDKHQPDKSGLYILAIDTIALNA